MRVLSAMPRYFLLISFSAIPYARYLLLRRAACAFLLLIALFVSVNGLKECPRDKGKENDAHKTRSNIEQFKSLSKIWQDSINNLHNIGTIKLLRK